MDTCDFRRVRAPCRGCAADERDAKHAEERRSPALRKAAAAGRWPADVYNLVLIVGPGEE